jgi:prepilin-type N-terminal cleavage/methylation domain-containing protein
MTDKVEELKKRRSEGGFTLVELLIVLAILAILVAVVLPNFTGLLSNSQTTAKSAEKNIIQTAVDARMAAEQLATYPEITTATNDMGASGFQLYPDYMRGPTSKYCYTVTTTGAVSEPADCSGP